MDKRAQSYLWQAQDGQLRRVYRFCHYPGRARIC